jgi:predicted transcriptional regulator
VDVPELSDTEADVLRAVHAEGSADLYDLAQVVGTGPRTVQEAVRALADHRLVLVTDRGRQVRCTPAGNDVARALQSTPTRPPDERRGGPDP